MNIFQQLYKSIYSPKDIAKFRFQGIGKTIRFIFLLAFISILPVAIQFLSFATDAFDTLRETAENELPAFTIDDGVLSSNESGPITLEKEGMTIIFDDTGEVKESKLDRDVNTLALLQHEFVIINQGNVQSSSYSLFGDAPLTKNDFLEILDSLESLKWILIPVALLVLYLFTSGMTFLKITIFAMIGVTFANLLKRNLQYRQSFRITAYSATVSTLFFTLMELLQTYIAAAPVLDWFVMTVILFLTVKEIPQRKART
ncbi:DUF1189 domain-containing protein [Bacillus sp. KH172YL63]|uniref:DUF1189 domain-containing protein n=1 Tax=Bacillus sp. KH172YL63 TaxID=2709784 RepID=UPI0013E5002B|nr:DUF1189 domain-containing protein [Bacillus sp. KH172YL63]BCB04834.1 hypothetical protein KH172YL63_29670 [Bacillus sp. KH172YL63]